jgi:hypothetical protein
MKWVRICQKMMMWWSVLDYILTCFPPNAMKNIIYLTNKKLEEDEQPEMGELLKFFSVLILVT